MTKTKVIALSNGKGGCGKSTIASNLAISLMKKKGCAVSAFDLDPQAAMEGFLLDYENKTANLKHKSVPQSSLGSLPKIITTEVGSSSHVILDVCGGDLMTVQGILPYTTSMILPCRPSKKDFASTTTFVIALARLITAFPDLKAYILINQCSFHPQSTIAQEMADRFKDLIQEGGLEGRVAVLDTRITVATAWVEADMNCLAISDTKTKSAKQWENLLKELTKKGVL